MSPLPRAIADAQRRALHDELRVAEERVSEIGARLREVDPHLVSMTDDDYAELRQLVRASGAALRRCEVLTG